MPERADPGTDRAGRPVGQPARPARGGRYPPGPQTVGSRRDGALFQAVSEARLSRIIKVDLQGKLFGYHLDEAARARAERLDGKLLLVTNTPDLTAPDIVSRNKSLADIERGFRVLESELEIGPVYHRLPDHTRAHAMLCFLALILYRVMRQRLQAAQTGLSPERALEFSGVM